MGGRVIRSGSQDGTGKVSKGSGSSASHSSSASASSSSSSSNSSHVPGHRTSHSRRVSSSAGATGSLRTVHSASRHVSTAGDGSSHSAESTTRARNSKSAQQSASGRFGRPRIGQPRAGMPKRSQRADDAAQHEGTARSSSRAVSSEQLRQSGRGVRSAQQGQVEQQTRSGRNSRSSRSVRSAGSGASVSSSGRTTRSNTEEHSIERAERGGFVDARQLHSDDVVAKTLNENVGVLGVATRPKILDFDARLRERRRASAQVIALRIVAVVAAVAAVVGLVWLLFFSSVFRLETSQISVYGSNEWVSQQDVLDIAQQQSGKSLLLVSTDDVSSQLKSIPGVTEATVVKRYPKSLSITVKAQQPAAMLKEASGTMIAVDRTARVLNAVGNVSTDGIPVIEVDDAHRSLQNRAVKEALKVLGGLPDPMRQTITKVTAKTQDSITTQMGDTYTVVWGDSSDLKLKAAIVDKIINDPTKIGDKHQVDVSAPSRPIIK